MLRHRMNKLIKLLEQDNDKEVLSLVHMPAYKKALLSLEDSGCVRVLRSGGEIYVITLLNHYATYQLERRDVWFNRILGFLFGVVTSVLTALIIGLLPI